MHDHTASSLSWRDWAACAHSPTTSFFVPRRPAACDRCPAAEPCLWAGLALDQLLGSAWGTWGGASAARRVRIAAQLGADLDYQALAEQAAATWRPPVASRSAA